tara:strand:- start:100 stop:363 length:264 start_codon:yes stop_codon:yes gene_type:complete
MAWSRKTAGRRAGYHPYTKENMKHVGWCIKNNIKICVAPHWTGTSEQWRVEIYINDNMHKDPKIYTAEEAHEKMYNYYKYYYEKYNV